MSCVTTMYFVHSLRCLYNGFFICGLNSSVKTVKISCISSIILFKLYLIRFYVLDLFNELINTYF